MYINEGSPGGGGAPGTFYLWTLGERPASATVAMCNLRCEKGAKVIF